MTFEMCVLCLCAVCLTCRHVSAYLTVQVRDPKAHRFLGQLYELEGETEKAVGCYKVCKLCMLHYIDINHYIQ